MRECCNRKFRTCVRLVAAQPYLIVTAPSQARNRKRIEPLRLWSVSEQAVPGVIAGKMDEMFAGGGSVHVTCALTATPGASREALETSRCTERNLTASIPQHVGIVWNMG
jgi:hypothetical protein